LVLGTDMTGDHTIADLAATAMEAEESGGYVRIDGARVWIVVRRCVEVRETPLGLYAEPRPYIVLAEAPPSLANSRASGRKWRAGGPDPVDRAGEAFRVLANGRV
ncbi:MAG: hypothetical protein ACREM8_07025, partial [Vulcanimicrobiaceae bacterium]